MNTSRVTPNTAGIESTAKTTSVASMTTSTMNSGVASLVRKLRFLKAGLAFVLAFVGVKMLTADRFPIPDLISLGVVAGLILGAGLASLLFPARDAGA